MMRSAPFGLGSVLLFASTALTSLTAAPMAVDASRAATAGVIRAAPEPQRAMPLRLAQNVRNSTGTGGVMNNIQGGPPKPDTTPIRGSSDEGGDIEDLELQRLKGKQGNNALSTNNSTTIQGPGGSKPAVLPRTTTRGRSGSDEGGDVEDLELQRVKGRQGATARTEDGGGSAGLPKNPKGVGGPATGTTAAPKLPQNATAKPVGGPTGGPAGTTPAMQKPGTLPGGTNNPRAMSGPPGSGVPKSGLPK